jgi:hypothetical protein
MAKTQLFRYYVGLEVAARVNNCKSSHILFSVWNCSYLRTIASHICFEFVDCNCSHVQTIGRHVIFYFLVWNHSYVHVMCGWLQAIFILNLWTAIVCTYERLQVMFFLLHLWSAIVGTYKLFQAIFVLNLWSEIVCIYKWFQAIFVVNFWTEIVRMYKWLQAIIFVSNLWSEIVRTWEIFQAIVCVLKFVDCNCSHVRTIASLFIFFIFGVQLFIHPNDCKSSHILFLDCNCSHVRTIASLFNFWSAIVWTYKRCQAMFLFIY